MIFLIFIWGHPELLYFSLLFNSCWLGDIAIWFHFYWGMQNRWTSSSFLLLRTCYCIFIYFITTCYKFYRHFLWCLVGIDIIHSYWSGWEFFIYLFSLCVCLFELILGYNFLPIALCFSEPFNRNCTNVDRKSDTISLRVTKFAWSYLLSVNSSRYWRSYFVYPNYFYDFFINFKSTFLTKPGYILFFTSNVLGPNLSSSSLMIIINSYFLSFSSFCTITS